MVKTIEKHISKLIADISARNQIDYGEFQAILWLYRGAERSEEYQTKEIQCLVEASLRYPLERTTDWSITKINWHDPINQVIGSFVSNILGGFVGATVMLLTFAENPEKPSVLFSLISFPIIAYSSNIAGKMFSFYAEHSELPSSILFQHDVCLCLSGVDMQDL